MAADALENVRIIELSGGRSVALAGLLLAEAGAQVVRIEPPAGDPERTISPGAFAVHNRSKTSLLLDFADTESTQELERLLAGADVLIHDRQAGFLEAQLDSHDLARRFPHLIVSHIGSWPEGHPLAATPVDDPLVMAQAGIFDEHPPVRRDGPGYVRFPLGEGGAAYLAANAIVARLFQRGRTGRGGLAGSSLIQGAMTSMLMRWSRAENPVEGLTSGYDRTISATQFECSDGLWIHIMTCPDKTPLMAQGLAALDPAVRDAANATRDYAPYPNWGANELVFKTRTRAEWLDELWANDVAAQPVLPLGEVYDDEQARQNRYVVEVDDPVLGRTTQPGPTISIAPPARVRGPAPRPGEGGGITAQWTPRPAPRSTAMNTDLPLKGIKVLDLGNFLAGPLAPMIMGDMGAEVIKLEATSGDQMRWVDWAFAGCQRGKRDIALDLKHADARPVLEQLVRWADVVHHNLRMPAARKLGLDYETLSAINPAIIYCHVSSYGPVGPRKDWPGFDQMFQSSCGWEYEGAGEANPPTWYRFGMMDHHCAMSSLLATLIALEQRAQDGKGRAVAGSLLGASMMSLRETVRLADGSLTPYPRLDAMQLGVSDRRRLYRCRNGWMMAVTEGDGVQQRLLENLSVADLAAVERRFEGMALGDAMAAIAEAGGHAVHAMEDQREAFLSDPANIAAGLVAVATHPVYGRFEQMGALFDFGDAKPCFDQAPPLLGEHSREILIECGFSDAQIVDLINKGAVIAA